MKEEKEELVAFDKDVSTKWEELIHLQRRQIESLGVPYFGANDEQDPETVKHQQKILQFLEDLIPGQGEE